MEKYRLSASGNVRKCLFPCFDVSLRGLHVSVLYYADCVMLGVGAMWNGCEFGMTACDACDWWDPFARLAGSNRSVQSRFIVCSVAEAALLKVKCILWSSSAFFVFGFGEMGGRGRVDLIFWLCFRMLYLC